LSANRRGSAAIKIMKRLFSYISSLKPYYEEEEAKVRTVHRFTTGIYILKRLYQNFSFWESNREIRGFARLKA
jgi:hypothetical protein